MGMFPAGFARRLLILGVALATPWTARGDSEEGRRSVFDDPRLRFESKLSLKITQGVKAKSGEFLAVVGLIEATDPRPRCGGTIVLQKDIVLTAGHCICDFIRGPHGKPNSNAMIGLGPADHPKWYLVSDFRADYDCDAFHPGSYKPGHDLGVLKLKNPTAVAPMAIADANRIDSASAFEVVGFGATDQDGKVYDFEKRHATIRALDNTCVGSRAGVPDRVAYGCAVGREIVAGQRESPDTCNGDSGGPLLVKSGVSFAIAGVTSRSIPNAPIWCGAGGIYERLTPEALVWIRGSVAAMNKATT